MAPAHHDFADHLFDLVALAVEGCIVRDGILGIAPVPFSEGFDTTIGRKTSERTALPVVVGSLLIIGP